MTEFKINGDTYTEEMYKRDLPRMFDYYRTKCSDYMGKMDCKNVACNDCPLNNNGCTTTKLQTFETIETVYNWAQDHPIYTNRDKLEKVFGINIIKSVVVDCEKREARHAYYFSNIKDKSITFSPISQEETFGDWLDEEYKEPKHD